MRLLLDNLEVHPCVIMDAMYSNIKYNAFHVLCRGKSQLPGIVEIYEYNDIR